MVLCCVSPRLSVRIDGATGVVDQSELSTVLAAEKQSLDDEPPATAVLGISMQAVVLTPVGSRLQQNEAQIGNANVSSSMEERIAGQWSGALRVPADEGNSDGSRRPTRPPGWTMGIDTSGQTGSGTALLKFEAHISMLGPDADSDASMAVAGAGWSLGASRLALSPLPAAHAKVSMFHTHATANL